MPDIINLNERGWIESDYGVVIDPETNQRWCEEWVMLAVRHHLFNLRTLYDLSLEGSDLDYRADLISEMHELLTWLEAHRHI